MSAEMILNKQSLGPMELTHFVFSNGEKRMEFAVGLVPPQFVLGMAMGSKLVIWTVPFEGTALFNAGVTADEVQEKLGLSSREEAVECAVLLSRAFMELPGSGYTPHIVF